MVTIDEAIGKKPARPIPDKGVEIGPALLQNLLAERISIRDMAQYEGQQVTLRGWVYNRTDKGKLQFIQLRDGTGVAQCVAFSARHTLTRSALGEVGRVAVRISQEVMKQLSRHVMNV